MSKQISKAKVLETYEDILHDAEPELSDGEVSYSEGFRDGAYMLYMALVYGARK